MVPTGRSVDTNNNHSSVALDQPRMIYHTHPLLTADARCSGVIVPTGRSLDTKRSTAHRVMLNFLSPKVMFSFLSPPPRTHR